MDAEVEPASNDEPFAEPAPAEAATIDDTPWFDQATPFDPSLEGTAVAIEILVLWGDSIIFTEHIDPPRSFYAGEVDSDCILPKEKLGTARMPIVLARWDGLVNLVIAQAATGTVVIDGVSLTLEPASRTAGARPSTALPGAVELPLLPGTTAWMHLGGFSFRVSALRAGLPFERSLDIPARAFATQAVSMGLHLLFLGVMAGLEPPSFDLGRYEISAEQKYELQKRLAGIDEKELERAEQRSSILARGRRRAAEREAELRYAGLSLPPEPPGAANAMRAAGWVDGRDLSMVGLLYDRTGETATRAPDSQPREPSTTGSQPQERSTTGRTPARRHTASTTNDSLPPEVIHRIIRQSFGRFRVCYEQGLRSNPNLQGRITVRFVIGVDGGISNLSSGGSDLPDSSVVQCVVRAFYGLSFPAPERGLATVVYPLLFSPGG